MELDKEGMEVLTSVLGTAPSLSDEDLASAAQTKKHSKPKKRDSLFLYGNEMAEILKSTQSTEQKLKAVCDKYSETLHTNRKLMMTNKMAEGRIVKLQQENEQCQQQRSKAVLTRSRLENLCRELQKLNKAQKEEIDLKLRLEEEKRKEISATFQSAFAEMSTLTNQNTEKNTKMREENLEMREKIKSVRERVELSEQQLEKVRQQAQLELQLAEAKMATVKMEMTAEKECLLKEKQQLLLKLTEYQVRISELQGTEVGLRSQISMYTEKYDDFQNALTKSNELFSGFNEEMEKMSKKILKLEKETSLWKQRWEKSHAALLEMASDKQTRDVEMEKLTHKLSLLQELCKAFQRERAELLAQLRAVDTSTASSNINNSKIDIMNNKEAKELSSDCQKLKDDLAHFHDSELMESVDQDITEESMMKSAVHEVNNAFKTQIALDTIESNDDNQIPRDGIVLKCVGQLQKNEEINNEKENVEKFNEFTCHVNQTCRFALKTPVEENECQYVGMVQPNELSISSQVNENPTIFGITQLAKTNELDKNECINDGVNNLIAVLHQTGYESDNSSQVVDENEEIVKNKINSAASVSADNDIRCKSNNDACMVSEYKKEIVGKQNNSNSSKKSSGKRKKK